MVLLSKSFYLKDTVEIAQKLLGCVLFRELEGKIYKSIIVETEAYTQEDAACHAYRGITPRCEVMYGEGGAAYVYFIYGMHYCVNVVTEKKGRGCAVLIRAVEPLNYEAKTNGPARLCKALNITKELNGADLTSKTSPIWIEKGEKTDFEIVTTPRIGIKQNVDYPWRFYIKDNKWVSA